MTVRGRVLPGGIDRLVRAYLEPPDDSRDMAAVVRVALWAAVGGSGFIAANTLLAGQKDVAGAAALFALAAVLLLGLAHRGELRLAGVLLPLTSLIAVTLTLYRGYGVHDVGMMCYPILVIFAGMTLDRAGASVFALLSAGAVFFLAWTESAGLRPAVSPPRAAVFDAASAAILLAVTATLVWVMMTGLREGLRRARETAGALAEDIRERRRVEAQLQTLVSELEAKNAELERFSYTVSHDLRSPLVTISAFLDLVEADAERGDAKRLGADLNVVRRAVATMRTLLSDLLELSRMDRGLQLRQVQTRGVAEEAAAMLAGAIAEQGVVVQIQERLPAVMADRARLLLLFQNLLENAIKFMGDQQRPRIEIGHERRRGKELFFVRDNGRGIEPNLQSRVFDVFTRLDPAVEGSGLGLALARRVVELHGGRIWVESVGPGGGSTFNFTLPQRAASGQLAT